ncbi:MAG: FAD-dependent oxidoreductase [Planctomycetota bacterium]
MDNDLKDCQVLILGAGAIGLTLAYELACRGQRVTVIERDSLPETIDGTTIQRYASSWAASGILPPANFQTATDPIDQLRGLSHRQFPDLAGRLLGETGIDCELDRCGGWYLADTVGEIASMTGMVSYWRELEIECVPVDPSELAEREPGLANWSSQRSARAWWVADEYQLHTPRFLSALTQACRGRGVRLIDQCELVSFDENDNQVVGTTRRGDSVDTFIAQQIALCGGVWTGLIQARMRLAESLVPVRGQIVLLKPPRRLFSSIVNLGHRYFVPRRDGHLLVGSCEEEVGFQSGTTDAVLDDLRAFARQICPQLSDAREVMSWSGLRPMTFDGFPMIGRMPGSQRVFVAAGHFRSGVHLAPGTASCLADVMLGQTPIMSLDAFRVGKQQSHAGPI